MVSVMLYEPVDSHSDPHFKTAMSQSKVIVIQLSGRKRWSVAREPSVYLSGKDQKRKPTRKEVEELQHYSEFTLCPGDILYIPRGQLMEYLSSFDVQKHHAH